jgi:arsenite methyltransferase
MSVPSPSRMADNSVPAWAKDILGTDVPGNGVAFHAHEQALVNDGGVLRSVGIAVSAQQNQTSDIFSFKWKKRDSYEQSLTAKLRSWLFERYGDVAHMPWLKQYGPSPLLVDLGCGACASSLELWADALPQLRFIGVDISEAVNVARDRFHERGFDGLFIRSDLHRVPIARGSVDLLFSEGVLHHCDDTREALASAASYLRPGGRILFYVYNKKGPIREFTDDYLRTKLRDLPPEKAWQMMMPLSRLGAELGKLDIEIDVPEAIDLLQIPAGRVNLQRLFYWHIFKAWYSPEASLDEMNHINFDWYAPRNAHRQTPEEVRAWCQQLGLQIERERVEEAGITVIAQKMAWAEP